MPAFKVAWRTRTGRAARHDVCDVVGEPPARIVLARLATWPEDFLIRHQALARVNAAPHLILRSLSPETCLSVALEASTLTLTCAAVEGISHYLRLADGTVKPLPPAPRPLAFQAGDTYAALSPGVQRVADSPAIARFLHVHDDFNAKTLAEALLNYLAELAGVAQWPEDVTALVIEAR